MNTATKYLTPGLALAAALAAGLVPAHAQITVNTPPAAVYLQPANPVAGTPGEFTFTGIIVNVSPTTLFLSGDELTPVAPTTSLVSGMTFDDSPFLGGAPDSLDALGGAAPSYTGTLFNMTIAPDTAPGTYAFTYDILGGTNAGAEDVIASTAPFTITIAAAPEPSAPVTAGLGALLLIGLGGATRLRARRKI